MNENSTDKKSRLLKMLEEGACDTARISGQIGELEGELAERYLSENKLSHAAVTFASQASFLVDARREEEALEAYGKALNCRPSPGFAFWIESQMEEIG